MIGSGVRWALMHELRGAPEPTLDQLVARMSPCDLLLVEGFKRYDMSKLEIYRAANAKPLLHPDDAHIVAVATDAALDTPLPQLDLNDPDAIAGFILKFHGFR
jgi:molybdopterin-guanine dinucleotide biosynthesis protein B